MVRTTSALAVIRPVMRRMTIGQTRTPKLSFSFTHSYAMAGSPMLSQHLSLFYVTQCPCLRSLHAYRHAQYPRLLAGGV